MQKGKISSLSYFWVCYFLRICTSPGKLLVARCFGNGAKLWVYNLGSSKPYFLLSWDSGLERGGLRIHSFRCLTEARIVSDVYVIITWYFRVIVISYDTYPIYLFWQCQMHELRLMAPHQTVEQWYLGHYWEFEDNQGVFSNPPEGVVSICAIKIGGLKIFC